MSILGSSPPFAARPVSLAARAYVRQYVENSASTALPEEGQKSGVIIAVSGGADSLSLALAVSDYTQRRGIPSTCVTVDHGLRAESGNEAEAVREQLLELGVENAVVLSASTTTDAPQTDCARPLESDARQLRYDLLETFAKEWGKEEGLSTVDILVGHTMDDQAETVLMRLGRGASPRALSSMRPRREVADSKNRPHEDLSDPRVFRGRPLLEVRRRDTEGFCIALGLLWVEDPTNSWEGTWRAADGRPLVRTALRHSVLPELREALGQDPIPALARVASFLGEDEDVLAKLAHEVFLAALCEGKEGVNGSSALELSIEALATHRRAIRRRVYLLAWEEALGRERYVGSDLERMHPHSSQIQTIDELVINPVGGPRDPVGKRLRLPGVEVRRTRHQLVFARL